MSVGFYQSAIFHILPKSQTQARKVYIEKNFAYVLYLSRLGATSSLTFKDISYAPFAQKNFLREYRSCHVERHLYSGQARRFEKRKLMCLFSRNVPLNKDLNKENECLRADMLISP
jgi:hypothetical protein